MVEQVDGHLLKARKSNRNRGHGTAAPLEPCATIEAEAMRLARGPMRKNTERSTSVTRKCLPVILSKMSTSVPTGGDGVAASPDNWFPCQLQGAHSCGLVTKPPVEDAKHGQIPGEGLAMPLVGFSLPPPLDWVERC